MKYRITSKDGVDLGTYSGANECEAHEAMCRDAGYASTEAAADALGRDPDDLFGDLYFEKMA